MSSPRASSDDRLSCIPSCAPSSCHFMIGYDHPFVDGNGRTARAHCFTGRMLRSGWWLAPYLLDLALPPAQRRQQVLARVSVRPPPTTTTPPTSSCIQLDIMERALTAARPLTYRSTAAAARHLVEQLGDSGFSELSAGHAGRRRSSSPTRIFTIAQQQNEQRVSYWAARADLQDLAERGYLLRERSGKKFLFRPAPRSRRADSVLPRGSLWLFEGMIHAA